MYASLLFVFFKTYIKKHFDKKKRKLFLYYIQIFNIIMINYLNNIKYKYFIVMIKYLSLYYYN